MTFKTMVILALLLRPNTMNIVVKNNNGITSNYTEDKYSLSFNNLSDDSATIATNLATCLQVQ